MFLNDATSLKTRLLTSTYLPEYYAEGKYTLSLSIKIVFTKTSIKTDQKLGHKVESKQHFAYTIEATILASSF